MITQELRNKTAENHIRLEQSRILLPFSEGILTRENYTLILQSFYGFFQPLERALGVLPVNTYVPDYDSRRKATSLQQDLHCLLGETYQSPELCTRLPAVQNMSQALGCLYVMEGSTLGGKLIYKRVQQYLGLDNLFGASFFYGYGAETGSRWKAFQQALVNFSSTYQTDQEIINAANDTFTTFKNWLDNSQ
jgi:heme oxygenase (biliverdin-IX-beta and delta-forming)